MTALYRKLIYVFPEMKLHDLVPNSYIHVSVSDLYIYRIGLPIWYVDGDTHLVYITL